MVIVAVVVSGLPFAVIVDRPSGLAQLGQTERGLGARSPSDPASGWMGRIGVPHLVQNLSLGTAPLPQPGQVQPVRRNRARREPAPWPPGAVGPNGAAVAAVGTGAGGAGAITGGAGGAGGASAGGTGAGGPGGCERGAS